MTPRKIDELLHSAAAAPIPAGGSQERSRAVWEHIRNGWDPERIEWQRWLHRWWPWVAAVVLLSSAAVAALPHGKHDAASPPVLGIFGGGAVNPNTASAR